MAKLDHASFMHFEDASPCCFLEIKSIGSIDPARMTKPLSNFVYDKLGVPLEKIYINFVDVPAKMWGWNGDTFG